MYSDENMRSEINTSLSRLYKKSSLHMIAQSSFAIFVFILLATNSRKEVMFFAFPASASAAIALFLVFVSSFRLADAAREYLSKGEPSTELYGIPDRVNATAISIKYLGWSIIIWWMAVFFVACNFYEDDMEKGAASILLSVSISLIFLAPGVAIFIGSKLAKNSANTSRLTSIITVGTSIVGSSGIAAVISRLYN